MRGPAATDLAGTWRLTRLAARRDRYTLAAWWAGLGLFVAATMAMFADSLARYGDLVRETRMVATNTGMRLLGLTSGPSVGGYMLHREFVSLAVLAALMSTFAVIRHTRQNEELGRVRDAQLDRRRTVRRAWPPPCWSPWPPTSSSPWCSRPRWS